MAKIITLEGLDGAGKHTQRLAVTHELMKAGLDVSSCSFPRYDSSTSSEHVKAFLNGKYGDPTAVNPYLAAFLFAQERLQNKEYLLHKVESCDILIIDRYVPSNIAYQGAKFFSAKPTQKELDAYQEFCREMHRLEYVENGLPEPDHVVYLRWPLKECLRHIAKRSAVGRPKDEIEKNGLYLGKVASVYENHFTAKQYSIVDCYKKNKPLAPEAITQEILKEILKTI